LHIWLYTFTTKMTHRTNLTIVVKVVDLDISCIYNHNHMVGMDKISSSDIHLILHMLFLWLLSFLLHLRKFVAMQSAKFWNTWKSLQALVFVSLEMELLIFWQHTMMLIIQLILMIINQELVFFVHEWRAWCLGITKTTMLFKLHYLS